jgi:hypothetical protein
MNRATWKAYYRLLRIARREALKASMDMVLFGLGVVKVGLDGPRHVPLQEFYNA